MGGLVVDGSFKRGTGTVVEFGVTDLAETISVRFDGILPDLFREGQTVVAEGMLGADGTFVADTVLAKLLSEGGLVLRDGHLYPPSA